MPSSFLLWQTKKELWYVSYILQQFQIFKQSYANKKLMLIISIISSQYQVEGLMMCESKMISKNNDEVDVGCGNAFGGEGAEEAGKTHYKY